MGRGRSKSGKVGVFNTTSSDELSQKVSSAYDIKVSRQTITLKDENGKTRGLIRGINQWDDLRFMDQSAINKIYKQSGANEGDTGIKRTDFFMRDKKIYILNNMYTQKTDYRYGNRKDRNKALKKLEDAGVIIVNYNQR